MWNAPAGSLMTRTSLIVSVGAVAPGFDTVMVAMLLLRPMCTGANASVRGENVRFGVAAPTEPMPLRSTWNGLLRPVWVMFSTAVRRPIAAGSNVTSIVQLPSGASV